MRRRDRSRFRQRAYLRHTERLRVESGLGRQAFLLVEATLAAAVIAVGLVFISRGISGSLKALAVIQQDDQLLHAAQSTLNTLEAHLQRFHTLPPSDDRDLGYRWHVSIQPVPVPADIAPGAFRAVTLTVSPAEKPTPTISLQTLWPSSWFSDQSP